MIKLYGEGVQTPFPAIKSSWSLVCTDVDASADVVAVVAVVVVVPTDLVDLDVAIVIDSLVDDGCWHVMVVVLLW